MTRSNTILWILIVLTGGVRHVFAQDSLRFLRQIDSVNSLQNSSHLERFFEKLYRLDSLRTGKINIVHIGDSHIQADYLTRIVRRHLQTRFGNAGRGLIVPCRVAGTNEPQNFISQSSGIWKSKRCVFPDEPLPIGIGGITVQTGLADDTLTIQMNDLWQDYRFNSVRIFHLKDSLSFDFDLYDTAFHEFGKVTSVDGPPHESNVALPFATGGLVIRTVRTDTVQLHGTLFGVSLENDSSGVLYHAIGVNGAKFKHYNVAEYFFEQLPLLKPDLVIISLGTNEALEYPYPDKSFWQHVDYFVSKVRAQNPDAAIIIITPQQTLRKRTKVNPGVAAIRQELLQFATENGLAFWDMYKVLGGRDSPDHWKKYQLLSPDGVHCTKPGYELQGTLLFDAITRSYKQYVQHRHR